LVSRPWQSLIPVWTKHKSAVGYLVAVLGVAAVAALLKLLGGQINSATVALALLLVVLFVAALWGLRPAIAASLFGVIALNYLFLPPVGRFTIAAPDNWIALLVFLVVAVTAGQLSARAKRRAEEAEAARREVERLYHELQDTFERSSQARALKQSERLKSALLDAVTHDMRTPLTSIKASVTTLLDEMRTAADDGEHAALGLEGRREMLEVIDEEADRLNRFIESLVELARIEAGEMKLERRWASVEEIIEIALERTAPLTRRHNMEIWYEEESLGVEADARALAEVVYTLIDNAVKYSPQGKAIRIRAGCFGDDAVRITVEDDGAGVPLELRERVFEKFNRATRDGDSASSQSTGLGMGLAIAKGIVEAHGGRIWIESVKEDAGCRVVVTLPTGDESK
jgi:K+-sensing histidine kinase KdpD